jgi:pimeloyl-ACP methyl ester carboxylesterase
MSDNWGTLGKRFSKYFSVHLVDLRNHGRSPHDKEFNYDVMCEDILEYIENHNIQNPIILGHSLGGKVAMKFAFTYPTKIAKLIVVDIAPRKYSINFHKNLLQKLSKLDLKYFTKRSDIEDALSLFVEDITVRLFLLKNLYKNDNRVFAWRFNIEVLLEELGNIQDNSFVDGVFDVPTCFIKGGDSDYINSADEQIIISHFSDLSIITINGAGHWLHSEKPEQFFNEAIEFSLM